MGSRLSVPRRTGLCVGAFLHDSESNLCQMTSYKMFGAVGFFSFWFPVGKLHRRNSVNMGADMI